MSIDLQVVRAAMVRLIERVEGEDWMGTCGGCRRKCSCRIEHDEILAQAQTALAELDGEK